MAFGSKSHKPCKACAMPLASCTCPEGVLVRCCCRFHSRPKLLGHGPRHQPSHHITSDNASHSSTRFAQRRQPSKTQRIQALLLAQDPPPTNGTTLKSLMLSSNGRRCSTVMPEAPPAVPLLADLKILEEDILLQCEWLGRVRSLHVE